MVFGKLSISQRVGEWFGKSDADKGPNHNDRVLEPAAAHLWGRSTICAMAVHTGGHGLNLVAVAALNGVVRVVSKDSETIVARNLVVSALWFVSHYLVGLAKDSLAIWDLSRCHQSQSLPSSPSGEVETNSPGSNSAARMRLHKNEGISYHLLNLKYETWCAEPLHETEAIMLGTSDGYVIFIDLSTSKPIQTGYTIYPHEHITKSKDKSSGVSCLSINEGGQEVLIGFECGLVSRYSISKRQTKKVIPGEGQTVASVMWLHRDEKSSNWHYLILYINGVLDEWGESSRKRRTNIDPTSELLGKDLDVIWCSSQEGIYSITIEDWSKSNIFSEPIRDAVFAPATTGKQADNLRTLDHGPGCVTPIGAPAPPWNVEFSDEDRPWILESMALANLALVLTEDQRLLVIGREWSWEFEWGSFLWQAPSTLAFKNIDVQRAIKSQPDMTPEMIRLAERDNAALEHVDKFLSLRCAHIQEACSGRSAKVPKWNISKRWNAMLGGPFGIYLSGHEDGTCRIWLACPGIVLLVHAVSLTTQASLSYRPLHNSKAPLGCRYFDGIDAAPCFSSDPQWGYFLTAVDLNISSSNNCYLALGSKDGCVAVFKWNDEVAPMSLAEETELQVTSMLDSNPDQVIPPTMAQGFQCIMRTNDHKGSITALQITSSGIVVADDEAMVSVTNFQCECLFLDDLGVVGPSICLDLEREATVATEGILILSQQAPDAPGVFKIPELIDDAIDPISYMVTLSNGRVRQIIRHGTMFELLPEENAVGLSAPIIGQGITHEGDATGSSFNPSRPHSPNPNDDDLMPCGVQLLFTHVEGIPIIVRTKMMTFRNQALWFNDNIRAAEVLRLDMQYVCALWSADSICSFVLLVLDGQKSSLEYLPLHTDVANLLADGKSGNYPKQASLSPGSMSGAPFRCATQLGYVHLGPHGRAILCSTSKNGMSTQVSVLEDHFPLDEIALAYPKKMLGQMLSELRQREEEEAEQKEQKDQRLQQSHGSGFFKGIGSVFQAKEKKSLRTIVCVPPLPPPKEKSTPITSSLEKDKDKLLGGKTKSNNNFFNQMGASSTSSSSKKGKEVDNRVQSTGEIVGQAKQKIGENIELLGEVGQKAEQMQQESANFLELAKKLNEKQKNSWW